MKKILKLKLKKIKHCKNDNSCKIDALCKSDLSCKSVPLFIFDSYPSKNSD